MCYTDATHPTDEAIDCYFGPLVASEPRKALVHAYAIALETNPLTGVEGLLTTSHIPLRVVWGTADTIFSSANAGYLSRVFDRSRESDGWLPPNCSGRRNGRTSSSRKRIGCGSRITTT
jgi:haloalkane dehalogenase